LGVFVRLVFSGSLQLGNGGTTTTTTVSFPRVLLSFSQRLVTEDSLDLLVCCGFTVRQTPPQCLPEPVGTAFSGQPCLADSLLHEPAEATQREGLPVLRGDDDDVGLGRRSQNFLQLGVNVDDDRHTGFAASLFCCAIFKLTPSHEVHVNTGSTNVEHKAISESLFGPYRPGLFEGC
jgi:hypothetical protein